jgi:hypothetical protein
MFHHGWKGSWSNSQFQHGWKGVWSITPFSAWLERVMVNKVSVIMAGKGRGLKVNFSMAG